MEGIDEAERSTTHVTSDSPRLEGPVPARAQSHLGRHRAPRPRRRSRWPRSSWPWCGTHANRPIASIAGFASGSSAGRQEDVPRFDWSALAVALRASEAPPCRGHDVRPSGCLRRCGRAWPRRGGSGGPLPRADRHHRRPGPCRAASRARQKLMLEPGGIRAAMRVFENARPASLTSLGGLALVSGHRRIGRRRLDRLVLRCRRLAARFDVGQVRGPRLVASAARALRAARNARNRTLAIGGRRLGGSRARIVGGGVVAAAGDEQEGKCNCSCRCAHRTNLALRSECSN